MITISPQSTNVILAPNRSSITVRAGGIAGPPGWTPVNALVTDGARVVVRVVDWTGGQGTKPATGLYVGTAGFVANIADAVNIRGSTGAAGANGINGADGQDGTDGREIELGADSTYIKWRYVGDATWINLVELITLKGAQGDQGPAGTNGTNATPITSITDDGNGNLTINTADTSFGPFALKGPQGDQGPQGEQGPAGEGVAIGGAIGDVLVKASTEDYVTGWETLGTMARQSAADVDITGGDITGLDKLAFGVTWNDGAQTFHLDDRQVTDTASGGDSTVLRIRVNGTVVAQIFKSGEIVVMASDGVTRNVRLVGNFQGGGLFFNGSNVQLVSDTASNVYFQFANLRFPNIPTSSAGLPSGSVWSDSGTLKITA